MEAQHIELPSVYFFPSAYFHMQKKVYAVCLLFLNSSVLWIFIDPLGLLSNKCYDNEKAMYHSFTEINNVITKQLVERQDRATKLASGMWLLRKEQPNKELC